MPRLRRLAALIAIPALLLSACGGDEEDATPATDAVATTQAAVATATPADAPTAIISISPTATEMLFAIGAGGQVIAVDDQSNYPPEAPTTALSSFEPNAEAIAEYEPDLVVAAYEGPAVEALRALDIEVLIQPAAVTIDDTYAQLAELGEITGQIDGAAAVVAEMRSRIDGIVASLPERTEGLTYYHELDDTLYSVTSNTFIGQVYGLLGLQNVADPADTSESGGYPQLSAEFLVEADPDFIFLADTKCCGESAETVAARPGFAELTAVTEGRVIELDDDIASRWGPRIVDLLETVAAAVESVPVT